MAVVLMARVLRRIVRVGDDLMIVWMRVWSILGLKLMIEMQGRPVCGRFWSLLVGMRMGTWLFAGWLDVVFEIGPHICFRHVKLVAKAILEGV